MITDIVKIANSSFSPINIQYFFTYSIAITAICTYLLTSCLLAISVNDLQTAEEKNMANRKDFNIKTQT